MAAHINPLAYLNEIEGTIQLNFEDYEGFLDLMIGFQEQRVSADDLLASIRELFKGHQPLISGFNDFLSRDHQIILNDDEIALSFVNKVKTKFWNDPHGFELFVLILDMYTLGKKSIIEVYVEVASLFQNHHDLLLDFKNYLPDTSIGVNRSSKQSIHDGKKRKAEDNVATQSLSLKDNSESSCVEVSLSSDVDCNGPKSHKESNKKVDFGRSNPSPSKDSGSSIQKLNLSKCEQITPSYRLLPADYAVTIPTGRPSEKMVLNDHLVCKSLENGDSSCTQNKMSANEQLGDTRFEMDLLMERLKSTIGNANKLLELINKNNPGANDVFRLEDYFTGQNMRCIERLYDEYGLEVLDLLRDNPSRVLLVILSRLLQKRTELVRYREYIDRCANNPQNIIPNEFGHKCNNKLKKID